MAKLKEELWKTLHDLKEDEFENFKWFLKEDGMLEGLSGIPVYQLEKAKRQDAVDLMVQKYPGSGALKVTLKILGNIDRNDLVQRLQNFRLEPRKEAIMAKLKEELWKTLRDLKEEEFENFKWFLKDDGILEGLSGIPVAQLEKAKRQDTVDLMVQKYPGSGALKVTLKTLENIHRNDLVQRLQNLRLGPKFENVPYFQQGAIMAKLKEELWKTLQDLKEEEFENFKWFLEQDGLLEGLSGIPVSQLEKAKRQHTVDLMVQKYPGSEALKGAKMANLPVKLWKALEELKDDEFKKFKWFLKQDNISAAQLEKADRQDTVDLMAQKYGSNGAVKETMTVLEKISRIDLVQGLKNSCLSSKVSGGNGQFLLVEPLDMGGWAPDADPTRIPTFEKLR
ncbi:hypothetical protein ABVT39_005026 [Epinephelus coioides]